MDFAEWFAEVSQNGWHCVAKRLAANDTLATHSHQAGPYLPKTAVLKLFPSINRLAKNPDRKNFPAFIDSHDIRKDVRVIWYNGKIVDDGTRDETRITRWGGAQSPVLDPDSTGAICFFAFKYAPGRDAELVRVWLATSLEEENAIEALVGEIEPGQYVEILNGKFERAEKTTRCALSSNEFPAEWRNDFPSGQEILSFLIQRFPKRYRTPDETLLWRRDCEYELFQSVEKQLVLPKISRGFSSVESFLEMAGSIMNRRKSRAGRSLELHLRVLFDDAEIRYSHGQKSEGNKKPDFIFPDISRYQSEPAGSKVLRMLGVKTTLKDRWRQILNEAEKIPRKHLFTLQQGVSENQFNEMRSSGVTLVVPKPYHGKFPKKIRPELLSLSAFIDEVRRIQQD